MELPDRLEREARFAARLDGEFAWLRSRVEKLQGVDWEAFERRVAEIIEEEATAVYIAMWLLMWDDWSGRLELGYPPGGLATIQREAAGYAKARAKDVAAKLKVNVRTSMRSAFANDQKKADAFTNRRDLKTVVAKNRTILDALPTPERAEVIATTEMTAARTEGQTSAQAQIERRGNIQLFMYWLTVQDDKVCKVCRPLHGTTQEVWKPKFRRGPIDAHPNCRCQLLPKLEPGVDIGPPVSSGRNRP